jgi:hypothetical protein
MREFVSLQPHSFHRAFAPRWVRALVGVTGSMLALAAWAQVGTIQLNGTRMSPSDLVQRIRNKTIWSASLIGADPSCATAHDLAFGPRDAAPAKERHDAASHYRKCLEALQNNVALENPNDASAPLALKSETDQADEKVAETGAQASFMGMNFGLGVGVSYSQHKIVSQAEVAQNGTIRAVKDETQEPRVILETHYYGWCSSRKCKTGEFGIGPFFGIVAKSDNLISAFGAGLMVGWKDAAKADSQGFSVGLGAILDSDVTSLAKGFEEGKPLPPGETTIKYETKSQWSALIFFTRTF